MAKLSIWATDRKNKPRIEWYSELINELLDTAKKEEAVEFEKQRAATSLDLVEKRPLNKIESLNLKSFPSGYDDRYWKDGKYNTEQINRICNIALVDVDAKLSIAIKIHESNIENIAHNQKIVDDLFKLMDKFGVKRQWTKYEYKSSRSRIRTEITKRAEWPEEIRSSFELGDGFISFQNTVDAFKKQVETWRKAETEKLAKVEAEEKVKQDAQNDVRLLALYQIKYNLEHTADWGDVLTVVLSKNKYLYLAHWLERNRCDWNDGYHYAKIGLDGFSIEDNIDQQIYNELSNIIENNDGDIDGRVFRDCQWNYNLLFETSPRELLEDYVKIKDKIRE